MNTIIYSVNGDEVGVFEKGITRTRKVLYCKSTDPVVTEGMRNADIRVEMDTKKVFLFDEDTKTWLEQ